MTQIPLISLSFQSLAPCCSFHKMKQSTLSQIRSPNKYEYEIQISSFCDYQRNNWELPHIIIKVLYIFGKKWEHVALRSSFRTYGYIMQAINNLRNSVFVSWPYFSHCYTNMSFFVFYRRVAWETRMSRWNISNGISI